MREERTRAYVQIHGEGQGTLHLPHGGKWIGYAEKVSVPREAEPGWYRCIGVCYLHWDVELGRKVDPAKEAERLQKLSEGNTRARTGSPGIGNYQRMEEKSSSALRVLRQVQRHYADLLAKAAKGN